MSWETAYENQAIHTKSISCEFLLPKKFGFLIAIVNVPNLEIFLLSYTRVKPTMITCPYMNQLHPNCFFFWKMSLIRHIHLVCQREHVNSLYLYFSSVEPIIYTFFFKYFVFYFVQNTSVELSDERGRPGAIVSNHVSYLDILYHMSSSFPSFVAKVGIL